MAWPRCSKKLEGAIALVGDGNYRAVAIRNREDLGGIDTEATVVASVPDASAYGAGLERAFHRALLEIARRSGSEAGYSSPLLFRMLTEHGGLATARSLLAARSISDGFAALWERKRLDLTVEAVVLRPEFVDLFDREELATASLRLADHGRS